MEDKLAKRATQNDNIVLKVGISRKEVHKLMKWEEEGKGRWYYGIQRKVGGMSCAGRAGGRRWCSHD